MHAPSRFQRTRSRSIVLHGALLAAAAALSGCGDDDEGRRLSPQVEAADGVYQSAAGSGAGNGAAWRSGASRSSDDGGNAQRTAPSRRGGFGSSGSFFHFGS